MKRLFAVSIFGLASLLACVQSHADEGRVADLQTPALDASRVSRYVGGRAKDSVAKDSVAPAAAAPSSKQHRPRAGAKPAAAKVMRQAAAMSARASLFSFFEVGSSLRADRDDDGFHSEFRIRFDADVAVGDALVYARLYLRRVGDRDWLLYHETDDFWIFGESDDDDYFVTTTLDDGFATGDYDVLIDLYESGFSGIVATVGPFDVAALSLLPLEETGLDAPIELPGYSLGNVSTALIVDADGDGHYSTFSIEFDPDSDFDGTFVYAVVWVRGQGGEWIEEHVTDDFIVDASGDADVYSFTADWISGYPTSHYDVQIDLHDAATSALVASAGSDRPELSRLPLEDQARDLRSNPPATGGGGSVTSRERGGGAMGEWFLVALLLLAALGYRVR
jgi:hypothetical protein